MATKKAAQKKIIEPVEQKPRVAEFFRFGESYTSLILGIIAVIIATVLLLSFVHNRQTIKLDQQTPETIHVTDEVPLTPSKAIPTDSQILTATSTARATNTPQPTNAPQQIETKPITGKTYTVARGDSLWTIAEKTYNDGDKWVAIARANHLSHPSQIHVGNKLVLPTVEVTKAQEPQTVRTMTVRPMQPTDNNAKITRETYTVQPGDSLSTIAERAYGAADAWTKISDANNLVNPSIIHVGNVLKLPGK